jgi:predicted phage terminase large subunit-like protein
MQQTKPYIFARNYLNDPIDTTNSLIKQEHLKYFELDLMPDIVSGVIHYDLTHTAKTSSDYSCVALVGKGIDNNFYIIDWHLSKDLDPLKQAEFALQFYLKHKSKYSINKMTFDAVGNDGFGQFARDKARLLDISLPLESKKYTGDKVTHLITHQSHFVAGRVFINSNHNQIDLATEQLFGFSAQSKSADDFVDAIISCLDYLVSAKYEVKTKKEIQEIANFYKNKHSNKNFTNEPEKSTT